MERLTVIVRFLKSPRNISRNGEPTLSETLIAELMMQVCTNKSKLVATMIRIILFIYLTKKHCYPMLATKQIQKKATIHLLDAQGTLRSETLPIGHSSSSFSLGS